MSENMASSIKDPVSIHAGALIASGFMTLGFSALFSDPRPNSTSALGCLFIPLWSVLFGGVAFLVTLLVRQFVKRPGRLAPMVVIPAYILVIGGAAWAGAEMAKSSEERARPRVLLGKERVSVVRSPERDTLTQAIELPLDVDPVLLDRYRLAAVETDDHLAVMIGDLPPVELSKRGLDYVTSVEAAKVRARDGSYAIALMVTGRATGNRASLFLLSENGRLLYWELMEREWSLGLPALGVASSRDGEGDVLVSAPECHCARGIVITSAT